jgi:hypothetical protein
MVIVSPFKGKRIKKKMKMKNENTFLIRLKLFYGKPIGQSGSLNQVHPGGQRSGGQPVPIHPGPQQSIKQLFPSSPISQLPSPQKSVGGGCIGPGGGGGPGPGPAAGALPQPGQSIRADNSNQVLRPVHSSTPIIVKKAEIKSQAP